MPENTSNRPKWGYTDASGQKVTALRDMFDGGGAGRSGDTFQGGGSISALANALGIRPMGYRERMAALQAAPAGGGSRPVTAPKSVPVPVMRPGSARPTAPVSAYTNSMLEQAYAGRSTPTVDPAIAALANIGGMSAAPAEGVAPDFTSPEMPLSSFGAPGVTPALGAGDMYIQQGASSQYYADTAAQLREQAKALPMGSRERVALMNQANALELERSSALLRERRAAEAPTGPTSTDTRGKPRDWGFDMGVGGSARGLIGTGFPEPYVPVARPTEAEAQISANNARIAEPELGAGVTVHVSDQFGGTIPFTVMPDGTVKQQTGGTLDPNEHPILVKEAQGLAMQQLTNPFWARQTNAYNIMRNVGLTPSELAYDFRSAGMPLPGGR